MREAKFPAGKYFNGGLAKNIGIQKERVAKGKCSLIIIDGIPGEGKTTMAVHVLEEYQGSCINYDLQYAMGFADFVKKLKSCIKEDLHVLIYDEAGDYNKRGWASSLNQQLNRIFETYRQFRIMIIMVGPCFYKYDNDLILTGTPRVLIHVHGRTDKFGLYKGYGLWRMTHIKKKMDSKSVACKHEVYNWVVPNFKGYFKNLPSNRAKKLEELSRQGKSEIFEEIEIKQEQYKDYRVMSELLNRSVQWVKKKVSDLEIKPIKIFRRKKYFTTDQLDLLREHLGQSK